MVIKLSNANQIV